MIVNPGSDRQQGPWDPDAKEWWIDTRNFWVLLPLLLVMVGTVVLVSVLGTLNATVLVGPRIAYAMALDGLFFRGIDRVHSSFLTPTAAIALRCWEVMRPTKAPPRSA